MTDFEAMSYDDWKTTDPGVEFLGSAEQKARPTDLERAAIELHDHLWKNLGVTDDWPLQVGGDDEEVTEMIRLMNLLQRAIRASGFQRIAYCGEDRIS